MNTFEMRSNSNYNSNYEPAFGCSLYMGQGVALPTNPEDDHLELSLMELMAYAEVYATNIDKKDNSFSAARLKQFDLTEFSGRSPYENYCSFEYGNILFSMSKSELELLAKSEK